MAEKEKKTKKVAKRCKTHKESNTRNVHATATAAEPRGKNCTSDTVPQEETNQQKVGKSEKQSEGSEAGQLQESKLRHLDGNEGNAEKKAEEAKVGTTERTANGETRLQELVIKLHRPKQMGQLIESEITYIIERALQLFKTEATMLEIEAPIVICGDIHGQYVDLIRLFQMSGWPPEKRYLFLGDYVDRGPQSIETICHLLVFKIMFPKEVFLLRGNHESRAVNIVYGFMSECASRYSMALFERFQEVFRWLPICALVSQKLFCMHGGISPQLTSFAQIRAIKRPVNVPRSGLICDLLWSDPDPHVSGWKPNDRGASLLFGSDVVLNFCKHFNIDVIVRAHQVVPKGYQFFAENHLVTLFSAPNYCNEFHNTGAILIVDKQLKCRVLQLQPLDEPKYPVT